MSQARRVNRQQENGGSSSNNNESSPQESLNHHYDIGGGRAGGGLVWKDLSVRTRKRMNGSTTFLLQNCSGMIPNGHLCGLLGPSGAGKSTMLSALGGTLAASVFSSPRDSTASTTSLFRGGGGLHLTGDIFYVNKDDEDNAPQHHHSLDIQSIAWLPQKDHFFNMLTVQETLDLAAFLELPPHVSKKERQQRISTILDSLGLTQLRHRLIGEQQSGLFHNGLSGGEKRRLSLAVELISSPQLFLGDEPTTGLDSSLSEKVVKLIKKMVVEKENIPCLLSLHQPRSSIWRMLDSVILLAPGGRVCYMGSTTDALPYFANLGYQCPTETNPAEFLLDLVSIDTEESPQVASQDEARIDRLAVAFFDYNNNGNRPANGVLRIPSSLQSVGRRQEATIQLGPTALITRNISRFAKLLQRAWRQNVRNHQVNAVRLFVSAGNAYFFANVFASVKKGHAYSVKTVPDRTALLSFGVINMAMMTVMKTIDLFAKEKPVVLREQQRRQYTSLEYLLSKTLAEIPLDAVFSVIFTTVLKSCSGLRIYWFDLTMTFSLMTLCGASLGFAIGACSPSAEIALSVGVPLMVLFLGVGVITPSGEAFMEENERPSVFVALLKQMSPIGYAIRAVCIAEYDGMEFYDPDLELRRGILTPFVILLRKVKCIFRMGGLALVKRGDEILYELGIGDETYVGSMVHLAVLSMLFLTIAWIGLMLQQAPQSKRRWGMSII